MRRILAVCFSVLLVIGSLSLSGCGNNNTGNLSEKNTSSSSESMTGNSTGESAYDSPYHQLEKPAVGDEVAVIHTNMGDITVRFFPEAAPKTVENFKGLVKKGALNNQSFYRVINNFMIQGGNKSDLNSIWGGSFEDEFDPNLMNIRGALSMANSGANTNGSQFFIVQAGTSSFNGWEYYEKNKEGAVYDYDSWTDEQKKIYEENGGTPWLDGGHRKDGAGHTVFGQVISGIDVVDKIAAVPTNSNDMPIQAVTIQSVELIAYQG